MEHIKNFFKGIIVGIGGIAPGLSGSVLMVILGLYTNVINSIATLFKNFKKNLQYLIPIGIGMLLGVVIFSRIINYSLENYEIPTRLLFFGLIIGTIPLFFRETKKEKDTRPFHYIIMGIAFVLGLYFFTFNNTLLNPVKELNIFTSFILGFIGIMSMIVPGIDGAATLSACGLYEKWLDLTSLNNIDLSIYIPAAFGMVVCAFTLAILINYLMKNYYTSTFSVLFGFFLSISPTVLRATSGNWIKLESNTSTYIGIILLIIGVLCSFFFSRIKKEDLR